MALQASVEIRDIAVVTGLGNFSRILGGALGVAISSAILNSHLTQELPQVLPLAEAKKIMESSDYVNHGLPEEYKTIAIGIYVNGLRMIWYVLVAMAGLGFIASFFVKHHSVRRHIKAASKEDPKENTATVIEVVTEEEGVEKVKIIPEEKQSNIEVISEEQTI
ncbi:hypothetical protein CU098_005755, partial [Rhizopus stolonifer]